MAALTLAASFEEQPANRVRSIKRAFVSDVEDKSWFYDRDYWRDYLSYLVTNRFNRFSLAFGRGYDFPRGVTGDYLRIPISGGAIAATCNRKALARRVPVEQLILFARASAGIFRRALLKAALAAVCVALPRARPELVHQGSRPAGICASLQNLRRDAPRFVVQYRTGEESRRLCLHCFQWCVHESMRAGGRD